MRILNALALPFLVGCTMPEGVQDAGTGVAAGFAAVPDAIVQGASALETGGWAAAAVVTALGLVRAGVTGWTAANRASKARRMGEIAEGVKKAGNGA